jgi:hypothetical protein
VDIPQTHCIEIEFLPRSSESLLPRYPSNSQLKLFAQQSMSLSQDVFNKKWTSIVTEAAMHRLQRLPENVETLTVTKAVFDDLLSVAQVAAQVQNPGRQPAEMSITYQDGRYNVTVRNDYIPSFTLSKPTLLEAIVAAQRKFDVEREKLIQ